MDEYTHSVLIYNNTQQRICHSRLEDAKTALAASRHEAANSLCGFEANVEMDRCEYRKEFAKKKKSMELAIDDEVSAFRKHLEEKMEREYERGPLAEWHIMLTDESLEYTDANSSADIKSQRREEMRLLAEYRQLNAHAQLEKAVDRSSEVNIRSNKVKLLVKSFDNLRDKFVQLNEATRSIEKYHDKYTIYRHVFAKHFG